MRRYLVGGNWKCNGSISFAKTFPAEVLKPVQFNAQKVEVVVAPSNIHMTLVQ